MHPSNWGCLSFNKLGVGRQTECNNIEKFICLDKVVTFGRLRKAFCQWVVWQTRSNNQLVDEVDVLFKKEFHGITCNPISWTTNPNVAFSLAWSCFFASKKPGTLKCVRESAGPRTRCQVLSVFVPSSYRNCEQINFRSKSCFMVIIMVDLHFCARWQWNCCLQPFRIPGCHFLVHALLKMCFDTATS